MKSPVSLKNFRSPEPELLAEFPVKDPAGAAMDAVPDIALTSRRVTAASPGWGKLRIIGNRLLGLALSLGCIGAALWLLLIFFITLYVSLPNSDFARFYQSTVSFWKTDGMYAWTPAISGTIVGLNTLDGEEVTLNLLNLNPPHFHLILLPLGLLSIESAYCLWILASLICVWISVTQTMRELDARFTSRVRQLALLIFLGSAVTTVMISLGQVGFVLLLPVTLMWLTARRQQWIACGVWLGLLVSIKPFFLIFVPYFMMKRNGRTLLAAASSAVASVAVGVLIFGMENYLAWLASLGPADSWGWLEMNASLWGFLARSLTDNPIYLPAGDLATGDIKLLWMVLGGLMGLLTLLVVYLDRSKQQLDRAFALLLVGMVLFSPLGWIYYLPLPLGPLAALLLLWRRTPPAQDQASSWPRWRGLLLGLALAGLFIQVGWTRWYQPSPLATLTLGSVYFWITFLVWLTLILDGVRHIRLPQAVRLVFRPAN